MPDIFQNLNESQRQAVMADEGSLLIVAGPGTGKTLTIVRRIAYLVHQGIRPENILAVTFTNRAAQEMRERTAAFLGKDSRNILIGTFHMFGLKLLRDNISDNFIVYNRDEQINLLKALLKDSGIGGSHGVMNVQQAADRISGIKNFLEDIDDGIKVIYENYQYALSKNSALDFDDLILKPIEMLSKGNLLEKYRDTFKHIIVDEYQDINPAQYRLIRLLTADKGNLCAVGDSDQAIYAFRGADVENFLNFEKDFKNSKTISLTQNYRTAGTILNASSSIIKNNLKRIAKELYPTKKMGSQIRVISVPDERAEGDFIVKEIEQRIGGTSHYQMYARGAEAPLQNPPEDHCSYSFSDFAVIFRTNAQAKAIEEAFITSGIPCQIIGKHLLRRKAIEDIILHLKAYATRMDTFNISIDEFLKAAWEESAIKEESNENCAFLRELAASYRNGESSGTIVDFINEISLFTPADDFDPKAEAVTLMTMHMAKGLEFKSVFIAGVEEGVLPYTMGKDDGDIEEERRLLYVGMTRAKEELFMLHARNRFIYGQSLNQSPSPFLREIPEELTQNIFIPDRIKKEKEKQIGLF